jgi:hypothetical protein
MEARINEKRITAAIFMVAMILIAIFSHVARAQSISPVNNVVANNTDNKNKTGNTINYSANVRIHTKAAAFKSSVNGPFSEIKPALSPDGKRLYFSRVLHPDNTHEQDFEDIWYCEFDEVTASWSDPVRLHGVLNNAGDNYINNVSVTGDTLILGNQYLKNGKMRAGLSYSVNEHGRWSHPTSITIRNDYNRSVDANAFVSIKNGVIISAIQRKETFGGRDLYVSFWDGHEASEPMNMGDVINSNLEESSPYLDADNETLYFASKGHSGYGGYDIFMTKRLDNTWTKWSEPENLGPAINGAMNDEFFSITHCGNYAVFSKQVSVHNTDIFRISIEELFVDRKSKKQEGPKESASLAGL